MKKTLIVLFILSLFPIISYAEELSLKNALDIATEKSPAIVSAREGVIAADGKLGQAFGAMLPNVSLSGQVGSSFTKPYDVYGVFSVNTREETAAVTNYSLTLTQPLFNGALLPGLQLAEAGYEIAKENYKKAQYDLIYNVVSTYYGVLRANKMNELSKDTLDMSRSHLKQVRAMLDAGTATRADVLRVEVQVANNEVGVMKADNSLILAKDAFNNILGRDLETDVALSDKEIAAEIVTPKSNKDCLVMAFENKPDWKIYKLNKKINANSKDIAWSGYLPSFAIVGSVISSKTDYPVADELDTDIYTNQVVASGQWALFDGLAREGRIKEAGANLKALEANEESIRNGIVLEVKDACLNLESAVKMIRSARKAVDLARENYRISRERYRTGAGSNLEMIDAQTAYSEASTNLYQAQFDYQVAKAKVNQAVGANVYPFVKEEAKL
jgi:outer membrane protein TolC